MRRSAGIAAAAVLGLAPATALAASHVATGEFDVSVSPSDPGQGPISTMTLEKTFHGGLEATSKGTMLAVGTPVDGSAGYVAMEDVTGSLDGRKGSFALQHMGTMDHGKQSLVIQVVPDSATGELAGMRGTLDIAIEAGVHHYTLRYTLPD